MRQASSRRFDRRGTAIGVLCALAAFVAVPVLGEAPAGAACNSLGASARWIGGYTENHAPGSFWDDGFIASGAAGVVTGSLTSVNGITTLPGTTIAGTLNCNALSGTITGIYGPGTSVVFTGTLASNDQITDGQWSTSSFGGVTGNFSSARVVQSAESPGPANDLNTGGPPTPAAPLAVSVYSPNLGSLAIAIGSTVAQELNGYQLLDAIVHISAPGASTDHPLDFNFVLDSSAVAGLDLAQLKLFRNGVPVADCLDPGAGTANPDPCVQYRDVLPSGDWDLQVLSSAASIWTFGTPAHGRPLRVWSGVLPKAKVGVAYTNTLVAFGGTPGYRWKKIGKLPKGLKLKARTGVISGTPKKAGTYALSVQAKDSGKRTLRRIVTKAIRITVG